jgi:sugar/nucleoside kinase (ribokinase family)
MADIGCAGILVADTICGPIDELPQEGALVALDAMPAKAGGCAANVAISLSKQHIAADVVGRLGNDPSAQVVLRALHQAGIGSQHITISDTQPTSQTVILLVRGQDRRFLHMFGANKEFAVSHIDRAWVNGLKIFYLGGLFVMPSIRTVELLDLLSFCNARGIITFVDVVLPRDQTGFGGLERLLPHIDYFVPNDDEACQITGTRDPLEQIRILRARGARTIIITRGEQGCVAAKGHDVWWVDAFPVSVVDPSGSGDAFTAGVIAGVYRGWNMPQTLTFGSALGASATRATGTTDGVFSDSEVEQFLASNSLTVTHETLE